MFEFAAHEFDAFILAKGFVRVPHQVTKTTSSDGDVVISTIGQLNASTIGQDNTTYARGATTIEFVASAAKMHLTILVSGKVLFTKPMHDFAEVRETVEEYCG